MSTAIVLTRWTRAVLHHISINCGHLISPHIPKSVRGRSSDTLPICMLSKFFAVTVRRAETHTVYVPGGDSPRLTTNRASRHSSVEAFRVRSLWQQWPIPTQFVQDADKSLFKRIRTSGTTSVTSCNSSFQTTTATELQSSTSTSQLYLLPQKLTIVTL